MNTATLDAPTITESDLDAFSKLLNEAPRCEARPYEPEHPATGRVTLTPCGHSGLACWPHWVEARDELAAWINRDGYDFMCGRCNVPITDVVWSDL